MRPTTPYLRLVRVTFETETPLSIGTGAETGLFDVALARDANRLPAIPGTSLAGVLRHLYTRYYGSEAARALFGYQDPREDKGEGSALEISWACIHDSDDRPVEGLRFEPAKPIDQDDLLARAHHERPLLRHHVRLGHRGAAADHGKFDRVALPAGYRFTAEFALWSDRANDDRLARLLGLMRTPELRIGGATRRGYGRLRVERAIEAAFSLDKCQDRIRLANLPPLSEWRSEDTESFHKIACTELPVSERMPLAAELILRPEAFWRVGQGDAIIGEPTSKKPPDMRPAVEEKVIWADGRGELKGPFLVVPGSAIKGPLAHRVAFHANRLSKPGRFVDQGETEEAASKISVDDLACHPAVTELFGHAKVSSAARAHSEEPAEKSSTVAKRGHAGRVLIDDCWIDVKDASLSVMPHTAIDRFTGGVRNGRLFSEQLVYKGEIKVKITVLRRDEICEPAREALKHALEDLCQGRLAIGAAAGRGHGYCEGKIEDPSFRKWLEWP